MNLIEDILSRVRESLPEATMTQLHPAHAVDDDGLWFFRVPDCEMEVQIESGTHLPPFLVEHSGGPSRAVCDTVDDTARLVSALLKLLSSPHQDIASPLLAAIPDIHRVAQIEIRGTSRALFAHATRGARSIELYPGSPNETLVCRGEADNDYMNDELSYPSLDAAILVAMNWLANTDDQENEEAQQESAPNAR